jgi:manganese oxidase
MADFRNHRHHGLIGALVIEAENVTPRRVAAGKNTAMRNAVEAWYGARATLVWQEPGQPERREEEVVLLMQDGLRLFLRGNVYMPIPDEPPAGDDELDHEDQGQKAFNYRSEPVGPAVGPSGTAIDWLNIDHPATPVWRVPEDRPVRLHLVSALDKPRNQSFTVHGVAWPEWRFLSPTRQPVVASEGAISCGTARTFVFTPAHSGDHAYRSGVLKWAVPQGLWGILRVAPRRGVLWTSRERA